MANLIVIRVKYTQSYNSDIKKLRNLEFNFLICIPIGKSLSTFIDFIITYIRINTLANRFELLRPWSFELQIYGELINTKWGAERGIKK